MLNLKPRNTTLKNLNQAITSCLTYSEDKYQDSKLVLVGTYYINNFLDENILSETIINDTLVNVRNGGFRTSISLKPMPAQLESLRVTETVLNSVDMGWFGGGSIDDPALKSSFEMDFLMGNSGLSNIQNYDLTLNMVDPVVTRVDTVINGVKYYQFAVTDSSELLGGVGEQDSLDNPVSVDHTLVLLFKEYTGDDMETFFSAFTQATELNKKDSKKVLDMISDQNLSGLYLGGVLALSGSDTSVVTSLLPHVDDLVISATDEAYRITCNSGSISIDRAGVVGVRVEYKSPGKYELRIGTAKTAVFIMLG